MEVIDYVRMGETIYETSNFEMFKGIGNEPAKLPRYLVRNKTHDVIEFESESLYMAKGWANFFNDKVDGPEMEEIEPAVEQIEFPDNVFPLTPKH